MCSAIMGGPSHSNLPPDLPGSIIENLPKDEVKLVASLTLDMGTVVAFGNAAADLLLNLDGLVLYLLERLAHPGGTAGG